MKRANLTMFLAAGVAAVLVPITNSASAEVTFDWVTVGNPGNAPDPLNVAYRPRIGSVPYVYRIAKYEVTNDQYAEFLNAVAVTDAYGLYDPSVVNDPRVGILQSGNSGSFAYSVKANMGNKPVNYVSFFDAMRFVNWLHNGQPTGEQDPSTTEDGVYAISDGLSETRAADAQFFIPTENEWYKAAYHQPEADGGDSDDYWLYPTASNNVPTIATANATGEISNPGANVANYDRDRGTNLLTTIGSAGPQSESYYGTSDQGGNVQEWTEGIVNNNQFRFLRGGSWFTFAEELSSPELWLADLPSDGDSDDGFRVAGLVPPPVTFDWATVGNPANAPDPENEAAIPGIGSVPNVYRIAKHEVTNDQYAQFLNAVAATDTNGLYNASMGTDARGGIIQSGSAVPLNILHRWSFNGDTTDSIAGADAILFDGASIANSALELNGFNGYAELPINDTIENLNNATFEAFIVWNGNSNWERIFDVGRDTSTNMFWTPQAFTAEHRFAIKTSGTSYQEQRVDTATFPSGLYTHAAVTVDADNGIIRLYVNGALVATNDAITGVPSQLTADGAVMAYLGKSTYAADPFFEGQIDEFRIYGSALSEQDIQDSFSVGPDPINIPASSGSFAYSVKANMGNKPVNYVSFFDAMRFVNWLHNGQPTGEQDSSTTEDGVYAISDGLSETRAAGAQFFIPTGNEWYKAAYHQPSAEGGDSDDYWLYPTASNIIPTVATANTTGEISNPGTNVANHNSGAAWNGQNGNVTTVGSAGPLSESYYGTSDQGGNVWEWNDKVRSMGSLPNSLRVLRGGAWNDVHYHLRSSTETGIFPSVEDSNFGFRVAGTVVPPVTFDWATVGNPANAPDPENEAAIPGIGSVPNVYRIAKHEVTNDQYAQFLNAVAATDTNGLYTDFMVTDPRGGITQIGLPGSFTYSAKTNMGNKPVNYVSFFDAMRFVNWLHNGQPTGEQDPSTTEDGVYAISDGLSETRAVDARYFIPTVNEWYKAAYHQPAADGGDSDDYWLYPTASNNVPTIATANATGDISNPGANVANYNSGADWNGQNGNVTTVGSAGPLSESYYGTSDQGGNVWEWNETPSSANSGERVYRGSSWQRFDNNLESRNQLDLPPASQANQYGFRVASPSFCDSAGSDCNANGLPDACDGDIPGDWNDDQIVNLIDHAFFINCLAGPNASTGYAECTDLCQSVFDQDHDNDVDLIDYQMFQQTATAPQ